MNDYQTLIAQFEKLKSEIDRERALEAERLLHLVVVRVREVLEGFGLDVDVVPRVRRPRLGGRKVKPKYWNPKTGETWSGRGRTPKWILTADRESFRISAEQNKAFEELVRQADKDE